MERNHVLAEDADRIRAALAVDVLSGGLGAGWEPAGESRLVLATYCLTWLDSLPQCTRR